MSKNKLHDNAEVIELLEKVSIGLFNLLDESCSINSNDANLLSKMRSVHKSNKLFKNPKMISSLSFIVVHTAK
jgi:myosin heavy subunit